MESKEPEPLDLISKYKLLDYPESKTRRCLQLFRMFFSELYPYVNYAMYLHAEKKGVWHEKGTVNIVRELYTLLPSARSDEMAKIKDILETQITFDGEPIWDQPMWIKFSDHAIDQLAQTGDYEALFKLRLEIDLMTETDQYIFLNDQKTSVFNGGDIPPEVNHFEIVNGDRSMEDSALPFFKSDGGGLHAMTSIFVTPNAVDNAKRLWDTWGMEKEDYKYVFCLLQLCKIQDIIHLARQRGEATPISRTGNRRGMYGIGHIESEFNGLHTSYRKEFDMLHVLGLRINPQFYIHNFYGFLINRTMSTVKDPSEYYFRYAAYLLDSPFQTVPVDFSKLRDPIYTKKWIFDCLTDFATQLEHVPPQDIDPVRWIAPHAATYARHLSRFFLIPTNLVTHVEKLNCDCSICYEEATNGYVTNPQNMTLVQPCNHCYHYKCIHRWLDQCNRNNQGYTCPNCRAPIQGLNINYRH
jgi:hypothetical protein